VGDSVGRSESGGFTGYVEGWERKRVLLGQGVIWEVVPEADWTTIPLGGLRSLLRGPKTKPGTGEIPLFRAPELQVARQRGARVDFHQVGYMHVVSFFEGGVQDGQYEKPGGHGVVWTKETETERFDRVWQWAWRISY
jgi:hypothetical protein